jgi:ribosomal protein L11 methylase PrmA
MAFGSGNSIYSKLHFESRGDVAETLSTYALSFISTIPQPRLLDLGCGSGAVSIAALSKRHDLSAVAIDISPLNIASTRAAAEKANVGNRLVAECADYVAWRGGTFDLIISDGVLQLIDTSTTELVRRLATDLVTGGYLIAAIPFESWPNSMRILLRRAWRHLPPVADRLARVVARHLHPEFSSEFLAERLSYLRITPVRLLNDQLLTEFESSGVQLVEQAPWASPSAAKLDHKLVVWRKL